MLNWLRNTIAQAKDCYPLGNNNRAIVLLFDPKEKLSDVVTLDDRMADQVVQYQSDEWSTIFDVYEHDDELIACIEEGHIDPWGEKIKVYSCNQNGFLEIENTERFVYIRGRYWRVGLLDVLSDPQFISQDALLPERFYSIVSYVYFYSFTFTFSIDYSHDDTASIELNQLYSQYMPQIQKYNINWQQMGF